MRSKRVTIPKLLVQPFKARKRSGREVALALAIFPDARMILYISYKTWGWGLEEAYFEIHNIVTRPAYSW